MKRLFGVIVLVFFLGCNSEKAWDCFRTSGHMVTQEFAVPEFDKITIRDRLKLVLKEGEVHQVKIETGSNLLNDIEVKVSEGRLEVTDKNSCNLVRKYGETIVYVTAPNITEIRSYSGFDVRSEGVLSYPSLKLLSENYEGPGVQNNGDFYLNLHVGNLDIISNGGSDFYLSGTAENGSFGLYSGDCRIYAENLKVNHIHFFHRSTGPMIINPQESLKGKILSLGDVISKNRPPVVEVEELYRGRLIFD